MPLLHRPILLRMTLKEALLWIVFYLFLASGLSVLNLYTHEGPLHIGKHVVLLLFKLMVNIAFFLPLWWLFFYKLKKQTLTRKVVLHFLILPLFSAAWVSVFAVYMRTTGFHPRYGLLEGLWDSYATAFHYLLTFGIMHAYNFWLDTRKQLQLQQELRELAHQSEIKALKAQIEPHFLFNTLNSISASVPPSLENTRVLIAQLADTFRYALQVSERSFVPLQEELQFIQTWLALEQHRFSRRLQVDYHIDETILSTPVPPMILQPLVENAIKHGIAPRIEGGRIAIVCTLCEGQVHISVSDTGAGYTGELKALLGKGIGLSNTHKRLQRLFHHGLQVSRGKQGLVFAFQVPQALSHKKGNAVPFP